MATAAQHRLTPASDTTPVIVRIPERELSGAQWASRFPGSRSANDLAELFKNNVIAFKSAIEAAGGLVSVNATFRPKERAYLMHWCWLIANKKHAPQRVPEMDGVSIEWDHGDDDSSIAAAEEMVVAYGMKKLRIAPALEGMHTRKEAIDMNISWDKTLEIKKKDGTTKKITTLPRDGMNEDLHEIGKEYGVIKFYLGAVDKPHWSTNGQ